MTTDAIKKLQDMLQQYQHGFRGLPSYVELQEIAALAQSNAQDAELLDFLSQAGSVDIKRWVCGEEITTALHSGATRIKIGEGKNLREAIRAVLAAKESEHG